MANKRNIEIQDHEGNIYNPHTAAKVVFLEDGKNVESQLAHMATEMNQVKNRGVEVKQGYVDALNSKKGTVASTSMTHEQLMQLVRWIKQGQGNAIKADVRRGKTFTNKDGVEYTGELDIPASKILKGQNIGGVGGTATSEANATTGDMINGKTAYVNGVKITGNIPVMQGLVKLIPTNADGNQNVDVLYPAGYYPNGLNVFVEMLGLLPQNIRKDITIGNVRGTLATLTYGTIRVDIGEYPAKKTVIIPGDVKSFTAKSWHANEGRFGGIGFKNSSGVMEVGYKPLQTEYMKLIKSDAIETILEFKSNNVYGSSLDIEYILG